MQTQKTGLSIYIAVAALFFLPAISVELLTGDTTLSGYLFPPIFIILNVTYGGAVLLIRETALRWGKGIGSMIVMAAGYGMLNEALQTKGFFDPNFYALKDAGLTGFGRVFGINVPWAMDISIYHAVFSVMVPLILISVIFPGRKLWLNRIEYVVLLLALGAVTAYCYVAIALPPSYYHYDEGPGPIALVLVLMTGLIFLAWKLPARISYQSKMRLSAPALYAIGIAFMLLYAAISWFRVGHTLSPLAFDTLLAVLFIVVPVALMIMISSPTRIGVVSLCAGLLTPQLLFFGIAAHTPGILFAEVVTLVVIGAAFVSARKSSSESTGLFTESENQSQSLGESLLPAV